MEYQKINDCKKSHVANESLKKSKKQSSILEILQSCNTNLSCQRKSTNQFFDGYKIVNSNSHNTVKEERDAWNLTVKGEWSPWVRIGDLYVSLTETGDMSWWPIIDQNIADDKYKFTIFSGRHGMEVGNFDHEDSKLETPFIREEYHYVRDVYAAILKMLMMYINNKIDTVGGIETDLYVKDLYEFINLRFPKFKDVYDKPSFIKGNKYKDIIGDLSNMNVFDLTNLLNKSAGINGIKETGGSEKGTFFSLNPALKGRKRLDIKVIDTFSHDDYLKIGTFKDAIKKELANGRVVILAWCFSINAFALKSDINRYENKSIVDIVKNEFGETSEYTVKYPIAPYKLL